MHSRSLCLPRGSSRVTVQPRRGEIGVALLSRPFRIPLANSSRHENEEPHPRPLPQGERGDLPAHWCVYGSPLPLGEGPGVGFLAPHRPNSPVVPVREWKGSPRSRSRALLPCPGTAGWSRTFHSLTVVARLPAPNLHRTLVAVVREEDPERRGVAAAGECRGHEKRCGRNGTRGDDFIGPIQETWP